MLSTVMKGSWTNDTKNENIKHEQLQATLRSTILYLSTEIWTVEALWMFVDLTKEFDKDIDQILWFYEKLLLWPYDNALHWKWTIVTRVLFKEISAFEAMVSYETFVDNHSRNKLL